MYAICLGVGPTTFITLIRNINLSVLVFFQNISRLLRYIKDILTYSFSSCLLLPTLIHKQMTNNLMRQLYYYRKIVMLNSSGSLFRFGKNVVIALFLSLDVLESLTLLSRLDTVSKSLCFYLYTRLI